MNRKIADYAMLSNCRSAALVSRHGSVDWLCLPRFDSPSLFAKLLDEGAGHFAISVRGLEPSDRRYCEDSLVLETVFSGPSGTCVITDALALKKGKRGHDLGEDSPALLLRSVLCTAGTVEVSLDLAPRFEYGLVQPVLAVADGGLRGRGGATAFFVSCREPLTQKLGTVSSIFMLKESQETLISLECAASTDAPPRARSQHELKKLLEDTKKGWRSWSALHQRYRGFWQELVAHSGRLLQGLVYQPTGAIVAAPTTSLPEVIGGSRNWDYRFTWIRDAAITMEALWISACPFEAKRFFQFLANTASAQLAQQRILQIMYGVGGEHDLTERDLHHLTGFANSAPVRIGNEAWTQRQLDVYGELLRSAVVLQDQLEELDDITCSFLVQVADAAANLWNEKDQGIWEGRGEAQHFVHSKLMCWVALDSAVSLAHLLKSENKVSHWMAVREEIRTAVLTRGWNAKENAFTQAFDSNELDASCLMLSIVGFLPGDDPRVLGTIDAICQRLTDRRGLVYRYRAEDGLGGEEGTFLLCTFWLAHAQALALRVDDAKETFSRAITFRNDVGLLSEEVSAEGDLLGNFPQAFSHVGLVNAAYAINEAERRTPRLFENIL